MSEPAAMESGCASGQTKAADIAGLASEPSAFLAGAEPFRLVWPVAVAAWAVILAVALGGLVLFYRRGLSNLYGDGIAHLEGARRLWDSLTPGYAEIGSAWLPLYHILASPLALSDTLWRTGLAGSIVSTAAFALTAWFLFRLAAEMSRCIAAGAVALAAFLACPSMLYLASTPLTEPLALLWAVLVVYSLYRYQQSGHAGALMSAAVCAFFGTLTRYDEWFVLPFAALFVLLARRAPWKQRLRHAILFGAIAGAGPALWVLHNTLRFGNPLEFYNGPYSAQAIYAHQVATTGFRYPTEGSLLLSARYYFEDLKLMIGPWPLELAVLGMVAWAAAARERARRSAALLFAVPLPFYLQSMAHAAVPLYVPTLFPWTYYNLRYGIEMLPAVAILASFLIAPGLERRIRFGLAAVLLGLFVAQAASMTARGVAELPVVKEGELNTPCRSRTQQAMLGFLRANYDGQTLLMGSGKYPCLLPELGIPYRKTLSEMNRRYWLAMRSDAGKWVGWVIRGTDDPVDKFMRSYPEAFRDFDLVAKYKFTGEDGVEIYRHRK